MSYEIVVLTNMAIAILFALSLNVITGFCGQVSLGHAAFLGIGAYFSGFIYARYGISPFYTAVFAGMVATVFGFGVGFITLRVKGAFFHHFIHCTSDDI